LLGVTLDDSVLEERGGLQSPLTDWHVALWPQAVALGAAVQAGIYQGQVGDLMVMDVWQASLMRAFAQHMEKQEARQQQQEQQAQQQGQQLEREGPYEGDDDDDDWGPEGELE
jgi:heat shock protein 1/8